MSFPTSRSARAGAGVASRVARVALPALLSCATVVPGDATAQAPPLRPVPGWAGWVTDDSLTAARPDAGDSVLTLHAGTALLDSVVLGDGVLEVSLRPGRQPRGFAGLVFRAASTDELELVYLRSHKAHHADALQYTPRFRGVDGWQLYSGRGAIATAAFDTTGWTRLRVEFAGDEARVFVDDAPEPQLVVPDLRRDERRGRVGLWSVSGMRFTSFRWRPAAASAAAAADAAPRAAAPPGTITRWELSPAFAADSAPAWHGGPAPWRWEAVATEASGLLNVSRHRAKRLTPRDQALASTDVVFARAVLRADRAERVALRVGYSDAVAIHLNGAPVYVGDNRFRGRDALFVGVVGADHDTLFLTLRPGENELAFALRDRSGGWGMLARVEPAP